jgi:hypothetical protein
VGKRTQGGQAASKHTLPAAAVQRHAGLKGSENALLFKADIAGASRNKSKGEC